MNQFDREAFVMALLAGELTLDDPQVQARLRAEPELRIMYEHMQEVEAEVARASALEREIVAAARSSADAEFAGSVTAAVQQVVAERQRARRIRWLAAAAVAAAALALGCFLLLRTPRAPDNLQLGADGLKPSGAVSGRYSPFVWPATPGTRYVLSIYGDAGMSRHLLYRSPEENVASPWQLSASEDDALPAEIWWKTEPQGGEPTESWTGHAWRQPR
jgi:hypothetical protein